MRSRPKKGSVTLVALCFVAVLGIGLASYLAVTNQSMKLSNRSYQTGLSEQLAEMGLEEAMRALNNNSWSGWAANGTTVAWSFNGTTANGTITLPNTKYGSSGIHGTVNLRVDNYNAFNLDAVWNATTNYPLNQSVLHSGTWYRCIFPHTNQEPPNTTYWVSASDTVLPAWNSGAYNLNDIVSYGGSYYRCILVPNVNHTPPNPTYWSTAPLLSTAWDFGKQYSANDTVSYNGIWYLCLSAHNGQTPPTTSPYYTSYWAGTADTTRQWNSTTAYPTGSYVSYGGVWYNCISDNTNITPNNSTYWTAVGAPVIYSEGVAKLPDSAYTTSIKTQLRATISPVPLFPNAAAAASSAILSSNGTVDSYDSKAVLGNLWSSTTAYGIGDGVFYPATGLTYRCIVAHTNQLPTNTSYWTPPATGHARWSAGATYSSGDIVYDPPTGLLYRYSNATASSGNPLTNLLYWSLETTGFANWSAGATYNSGDIVYEYPPTGLLYRYSNATGSSGNPLTNSSYWTQVASYSGWSAAATYNMHQIVYYSNVLYRSLVDLNTNSLPPSNPSSWSTSMPVYSGWLSNTTYSYGNIVYYPPTGLLYRYSNATASTGNLPTTSTPYWTSPYWTYLGPGHTSWSSTVNYSYGYIVYYPPDGWLYRYSNATASSGNLPNDSTSIYWTKLNPGYSGWSAAATYNTDDVVYYYDPSTGIGLLYRCTSDLNTNHLPTDTAYWSAPLSSYSGWSPATTYNTGDLVYYPTTGLLYRYGNATASSGNLPTDTTYWFQLGPGPVSWLPVTAYSVGDVVYYYNPPTAPGLLYRCITGHTSTIAINPTNTTYWSTALPGNSAVIAGGNTTSTAVNITNTTVHGYVAAPSASTAPYAPRWTYGGTASLTGTAATGVDLTRVSRSPFIPQFDILTPNTGPASPFPDNPNVPILLGSPTDTTWHTYLYTNNSGNLFIPTSDTRVYTVDGPVRIVIPGYYYQNTTPGGTAKIIITNKPTSKLEMFIGGDIAIYANGIDNLTRLPKNLAIYGTTALVAPDMYTPTPFYGVIYLPNAKFTVQTGQNIYGALSAKNLTFSTTANLHYDTALRTTTFTGTDAPCMISEWRELTDPAEKVTLP